MSSPSSNTTGLTDTTLALQLQQTVADYMSYISHVRMRALIDQPPNAAAPITEEIAHIVDMVGAENEWLSQMLKMLQLAIDLNTTFVCHLDLRHSSLNGW
ncbi:hypothetical protein AX17_007197 [Amanita inopinata Kibby_2008]|nr:hypothetical protein AX17_007197 [Amanita inopinata Kibby_2008]